MSMFPPSLHPVTSQGSQKWVVGRICTPEIIKCCRSRLVSLDSQVLALYLTKPSPGPWAGPWLPRLPTSPPTAHWEPSVAGADAKRAAYPG